MAVLEGSLLHAGGELASTPSPDKAAGSEALQSACSVCLPRTPCMLAASLPNKISTPCWRPCALAAFDILLTVLYSGYRSAVQCACDAGADQVPEEIEGTKAAEVEFVQHPQDGSADAVLNLALAPSYITYNAASVQRVSGFFASEKVSLQAHHGGLPSRGQLHQSSRPSQRCHAL